MRCLIEIFCFGVFAIAGIVMLGGAYHYPGMLLWLAGSAGLLSYGLYYK